LVIVVLASRGRRRQRLQQRGDPRQCGGNGDGAADEATPRQACGDHVLERLVGRGIADLVVRRSMTSEASPLGVAPTGVLRGDPILTHP
jgi:hypothetical protein